MSDVQNEHCFFITPLGADGSDVRIRADEIQSLIVNVLRDRGLVLLRADQLGEPGQITEQIVRAIMQSVMVFADLTGANANVYYELGVAHSLGRPVISLIDKVRDLAFDAAHDRAVIIGDDGRLSLAQGRATEERLAHFVETVMSGSFRPHNVVSEAASLAAVRDLAGEDPVSSLVSQTHAEIEDIRRLLDERLGFPDRIDSSDGSLMRALIERLVNEYPVDAGTIRNSLLDGRTTAAHDDWVEALLARM